MNWKDGDLLFGEQSEQPNREPNNVIQLALLCVADDGMKGLEELVCPGSHVQPSWSTTTGISPTNPWKLKPSVESPMQGQNINQLSLFNNTLWKLRQLWKITILNGKADYKWPYSIATLNYRRVCRMIRGNMRNIPGCFQEASLCTHICCLGMSVSTLPSPFQMAYGCVFFQDKFL